LVIKTLHPDWIRIGIQPKVLDPDPVQMNADCGSATLVVIIKKGGKTPANTPKLC
jgi:hypothetical protein